MNPWNKNLHGEEYLNHYKDKKIWNDGLTKETDKRVKEKSEKMIGHKVLTETIEKILKTKKEKYPDGIKSWNVGLTKKTDERVKKQSEKIFGHKVLEETKEKISKSLKGKMSGDKNPSKRPEVRKKISEALSDKPRKREYVNDLVEIRKKNNSYKQKEETKQKIRENAKNNPNFGMKEKYLTEEQKKKAVETRKKNNSYVYTEELKRKRSAFMQGIPLEKWEKFTSREPYGQEFDGQFKRLILKRDNYICMKCEIPIDKLNKSLIIHHIDYNKRLSIPENCISLCDSKPNSCHQRTNTNREYWRKLFQEKLSKLYGYEYEEYLKN